MTALTLLITAMQLLTMVANTPSLPVEFKNHAIQIANQAVIVAQEEIAKQNITSAQPIIIPTVQPQALQVPTFSGTIKNMQKEITIDIGEKIANGDKTHFAIRAFYKEDGISKQVPITLTTTDGGEFEHRNPNIPAEQNKGLSPSPVTIEGKIIPYQAHKDGRDTGVYVMYRASLPVTITVEAGGVTEQVTVQ